MPRVVVPAMLIEAGKEIELLQTQMRQIEDKEEAARAQRRVDAVGLGRHP